jgi:hypothetical protein
LRIEKNTNTLAAGLSQGVLLPFPGKQIGEAALQWFSTIIIFAISLRIFPKTLLTNTKSTINCEL